MADNDKRSPVVRVIKDGPYLVSGGLPVKVMTIGLDGSGDSVDWRMGEEFPVEETYRLCRCGRSSTKPFCDGSHKAAGFDGTETARRERYRDYARELNGPGLTLTDAPELCASARYCLRAGGIWFLIRRSRYPEARQIAIREAADCPAGRLVVWDDAGKPIEPELAREIGAVQDPKADMAGPLWLRGGIPVVASDGFDYEVRNRVTLCRCGRSGNKPFCDGSHVYG
jgi:CDGSH-type Zn-finger protein